MLIELLLALDCIPVQGAGVATEYWRDTKIPDV